MLNFPPLILPRLHSQQWRRYIFDSVVSISTAASSKC